MRPRFATVIATLAIASTGACKKDGEAGEAEATEVVDWKTACAGNPEDIPLPRSKLVARVGGKPVDLEAEIGRGGIIFRGEDIHLVIPASGTPRTEALVEYWSGHLRGRAAPPVLRGHLPGLKGPPMPDVLRLELNPMNNGKVVGRIALCLEAPAETVIAGQVTATVAEDLSDAPDPGRDHPSTLAYLAERKLGRGPKPTRTARFLHRGARLDADAGHGYEHVLVKGKGPARKAHTLTFKKVDGEWTVDRVFAGDQIPEAHLAQEPSAPSEAAIAMVALRAEELVHKARPGATFRSQVTPTIEKEGGTVEVRVVTDAAGRNKPEAVTFTAQLETDGEAWKIAKLESDRPEFAPPAPTPTSPPADPAEK